MIPASSRSRTMRNVSPKAEPGGLRGRMQNPVVQFALAGFVTVLVVGGVAAYLLSKAGEDEAVRDAKRVTRLAAEGVVEPLVTDDLFAKNPNELERIDEAVKDRVLGREGIVRVKIWDADSQILYSDEDRLIGQKFSLGEEELEILRDGGVEADQTDLTEPENQYEPSGSDLLEVYLPIHTPTGKPLLFETYIKSSFINTGEQRVLSTLAPILLGALLILAVLQLPLASSLAKRLRRGQVEREALLNRAIDASEMERRRIAQDLHDGVVQDIAGVSYSIAAAASRTGDDRSVDRDGLRQGAARLRQSVRDLRGLLVELYPADLHRVGLEAALSDVIGGLNSRGLEADLDVPDDIDLPEKEETLLFRVAQEALRNVVAHAGATCVQIRIADDGQLVSLEVEDDGIGFDAEVAGPEGHFGLRMLEDLTHDAGGAFRVDSEPGRGTTVRVEVPRS
jgi:two-component system, NarL family, sensor kinase